MPKIPTPEQIIAAIRKRGSDATTLRDAAHEAQHALECGCTKPWTRDNVHRAVLRHASKLAGARRNFSEQVALEVRARATEMLVVQAYGEPYNLDEWAATMWWETLKNAQISLPADPWARDAIARAAKTKSILAWRDKVIQLGANDG